MDRIWSSPLTRSIQTALIAFQGHPSLQRKGLRLAANAREVKGRGGIDSIGRGRGGAIIEVVLAEMRRLYGCSSSSSSSDGVQKEKDGVAMATDAAGTDGIDSQDQEESGSVVGTQDSAKAMIFHSVADNGAVQENGRIESKGRSTDKEKPPPCDGEGLDGTKEQGKGGIGSVDDAISSGKPTPPLLPSLDTYSEEEVVKRLTAPSLDVSDALDRWWTGFFEYDRAEDVDMRLNELLNEVKFSEDSSIVIVSHSNLIKAVLSRRLHTSVRTKKPSLAREAAESKLANCNVVKVDLDFSLDITECIVDFALAFDSRFEESVKLQQQIQNTVRNINHDVGMHRKSDARSGGGVVRQLNQRLRHSTQVIRNRLSPPRGSRKDALSSTPISEEKSSQATPPATTKATDLHDESYSLSFARGASGSGSEFLMDSPMYQKEMRTAASESMTATPNVVISEVSVVDE